MRWNALRIIASPTMEAIGRGLEAGTNGLLRWIKTLSLTIDSHRERGQIKGITVPAGE